MQKNTSIFRRRSAGYYVSLIASLMFIAMAIIFFISFNGYTAGDVTTYDYLDYLRSPLFFWITFGLALGGGVAFLILALFKPTERIGALILVLAGFASFLLFLLSTYMYFSKAFYGGFKSFDQILDMNPFFSSCLFLSLLGFIVANVGVYLKQSKDYIKAK